jgi:uncharacterized protein YjdB
MRAPKTKTNYICNITLLFTIFLTLLSTNNLSAQQLAFPTAKGAGAYATGGRGGQVIHVTTLDWNAPGGLKEAITTPGPRIIVFDVSGEIDATSEGAYTPIISGSQYNNITIAGQTAPAGGITIRTTEFMFQNVSNVVIRYLRFRNNVGSIQDAFWFTGGNNIVVDHCTFSHGGDESGSMGSSVGVMGDITMQNCFFQDSKTGTILGVDNVDGDFTFVDNVYSSISHRFPNPKGDGQYDIINNIVYNWKYRLIRISGEGTYNVMNNYYKPAANGLRHPSWFGDGQINTFLQKVQTQASDSPLIYSSGSIVTGQRETPLSDDSDMWTVFAGSHLAENSPVPAQYFTHEQFPLVGQGFTIKTANQTYIDALNNVGADKTLNADGTINAYRDDKDSADILMIQNDTYEGSFFSDRTTIAYPTVPQNVRPDGFDSNNDGMPDVWKVSKGYDITDDISDHVWASGYVGVEEYLNEIDLNSIQFIDVTGVEVSPETAIINIPQTIDLESMVLPENASNKSGIWSSSDNSIATVSVSGLVTPLLEGEVTITFTTNDGSFTDDSTITVTNIITALESVNITPDMTTLDLGENLQLEAEFFPSNTTDITGTWNSNDDSIVTVNESGFITAISEGIAEVSFVANDGGITDTTIVTVIDDFFGEYILYNANTDVIIQNIEGDAQINLANEGDQINFRSIPEGGDENPDVESVEITWNGPTNGVWVESAPLYAGLPGGHVDLDFEPYTVVEGTYNFTVTYYSEDGASGTVVAIDNFSLSFFFSFLPVANAGPDQAICEGETATLIASGGPNFLWNNGETTASIEVLPTETTTYSVTVFDDEGNTDEDSVIVTVNAIPTANAGEDQTICEGESIILTASGGISYLWSTGETTESIEVNPEIETTYDVEVISNDCSSTDSITVFVNYAPEITISEDIVIVEGESTTLIAGGSDNYEWSTGDTTDSITVNPLVTTTYSVSSIGVNGCSTSLDVIVTVIPEVIADAGEDATICNGENITLNATGGVTYLWDTGDTNSTLTVSPEITTTYTVTVEDDYGYTDTDSVTIIVNELPDIIADEDVFVMIGNSVTISAAGGDNYSWNTGETTASITVSPETTTTYSVTGFSVNGCQSTVDVLVTVVEQLNANAGEDVSICIGNSVTLSASGGITYTWNTGDTGSSPTFTPDVTTTYSVTVTDGFGNSDTDDVTVTVDSMPIAYAGENQTVCEGDAVTLTAEGGSSYLWNTGATTASITVNPEVDTIYSVEVFNNACSDSDDVTIFVMSAPDLNVSDDIVVMNGNSTTLEVSGADTYLWNTGETTNSVIVSPSETTVYSVTGYGPNGCQSTEQITVTVVPQVIADAGNDETICRGESVTLHASGGVSYLWNTGFIGRFPTFSPSDTTTYTVTVTDAYGNSDSDSVTIIVNELPILEISENQTIVDGESVTLHVSGAENYIWNTGETSSSIVVSPLQTTTYSVIGSTNTCSAQAQVTIYVEELFEASAGTDVQVCDSDNYYVVLTANQGDSYLWSTGETEQSIVVSPLSTTEYIVTITNGTQEDSDEVTVYVNPSPTVEIANGDSVEILSGDYITLSASGANSYQWNNGASQPNIAVSPSSTTIYEVRGFVGDCYDEKQVTVNVLQPVEADAGEDVIICLDEIATLTATGGDDYVWSTGETTQTIQVSPTETTDYTVTVFNALDFDEASVRVEVDLNCQIETVVPPIDEMLDFSFDIFPNPAVNSVNVKLSGTTIGSNVLIYDFTGKIVKRTEIYNEELSPVTTAQIDISTLQSGVYFVKLIDEDRDITKKLIVR